MRRRNWINKQFWGWLGRLLNIHLPMAHAKECCWCKGTKRELANPEGFVNESRAREELKSYRQFFGDIYCFGTMQCSNQVPHFHGDHCGEHCITCRILTTEE